MALMEAMAMEIACVSTYVGAIPELIRDGLDGLLVPPSSHEGLVTAIEQLIVDPSFGETSLPLDGAAFSSSITSNGMCARWRLPWRGTCPHSFLRHRAAAFLAPVH